MLVLALIAVAVQTLPQAWTRPDRPSAHAPSSADSARIVRSARSAQAAFERFRRRLLPMDRGGGAMPCDVRIGRYCYWRGDEEDSRPAPPEAAAITEHRDTLIKKLEIGGTALPGDPWIAGQRVHYLIDAGRAGEAWRFARHDCAADRSWCLALAGYAAHEAHRYDAADTAFAEALDGMDPAERCAWLDAAELLDDDLAHRFDAMQCEGRRRFVRRLFVLGAPLYSVSRTDLLTEYFTRITRARIAKRSATIDGVSWADDGRELVTRYGWPRWYSRSVPPIGSQRGESVTGHDAGLPYDYLPSLHALEHIGDATHADWHLEDPRARTGYAPAYARSMHELPSQVARFQRRDSMLVVAAWDARRDTTLHGRALDAALVVLDQDLNAVVRRQSAAGSIGRLAVTACADSGIVSLELLARESRRAARARIGVERVPPGTLGLSDLLLFAARPDATIDLTTALGSALAGTRIPDSRGVGVFWEAYGVPATGAAAQFTLTVEETDIGFLRRAAQRVGVADPTTTLRIQWTEVPRQHEGIAPRSVWLDLSQLRRGHYHVQLAIDVNGSRAVSSRDVDVR